LNHPEIRLPAGGGEQKQGQNFRHILHLIPRRLSASSLIQPWGGAHQRRMLIIPHLLQDHQGPFSGNPLFPGLGRGHDKGHAHHRHEAAGGGGTGGIGIYAQNCTINGDITIDTTEVSRGIAVENVLTIQNCQYSGAYITASSIYITGGTLQINGTANAVNCIVASNLFQMSGNASLTLTTTANSITLTCISAQRAVINSGTLTATANGAFGRAINAVFDIRLNSPDIVLFGGQCAVFSGNDTVVFGNSVLGFAGADAAGAVKNRRVNDTYKYVKTQLFVFTPQDLVFDALLEDGEVIEFGENIAYFEGIIANGVALVRDRDYIIEGENVRLTDSFLRSLPDGVLWLELQFGDGFTKTVSLTVTNSSVVISPAPQKDFVGIIVVASLSAVLVALFALSAVKEFRKKKRARKDSGLFLD